MSRDEIRETTPAVNAIGEINFSGNMTPRVWYQCPDLKYPSGVTYLKAITLLSDICYWYTPTEIPGERSGEIIGYSRKFYGHRLEKNYKDWGEQFGISERDVRDAIGHLVKVNLIIREVWRPSNRVFIEPIPARILEITHRSVSRVTPVREPDTDEPGAGSLPDVAPPTVERERSTKSTPENTHKVHTPSVPSDVPLSISLSDNTKELLTEALCKLRVSPDMARDAVKKWPERAARAVAYWQAHGDYLKGADNPGGVVYESIKLPAKYAKVYAQPEPVESHTNGHTNAPKPTTAQLDAAIAQEETRVYEALPPKLRAEVDREVEQGSDFSAVMERRFNVKASAWAILNGVK